MPGWDGMERRSAPRVTLGGFDCGLAIRMRVQLVDLSLTGALLLTESPLPRAAVGHLCTVLTAGPFTPVVEILRHAPGPKDKGHQLGTQFHGMDDRSREVLEGFLSRAAK